MRAWVDLSEVAEELTGARARAQRQGAPASGPNMATTSLTLVGHAADAPDPILRRLPATGHEADMLDVSDPDVGEDAETCPYQQPQRTMRSTACAGRLGG